MQADQKFYATYQLLNSDKSAAPFFSKYDMVFHLVHRNLPFNVAKAIMPSREVAEKMNQQFLQLQAMAAAREAMGKRTREPRVKRMQNTGAEIIPK